MGKGRPRAVEQAVLGHAVSSSGVGGVGGLSGVPRPPTSPNQYFQQTPGEKPSINFSLSPYKYLHRSTSLSSIYALQPKIQSRLLTDDMLERKMAIGEAQLAGFEERTLVGEIVKQALECRTYLTEIVTRAFSIHEKDISSISESLLCALKAIAVAGVYDHQDRCNLEAAFSRNSWKIRVKKLFEGSNKPTIEQVQRLLKEGLAVGLSSEDHFMQEITKAKQISLKWVDEAKKVAFDLGTLELSEVFKLMSEGEALLVYFEKKMKLLRE